MEAEKLVLGALLHDIGKFAQRAGRPRSDKLADQYLTHYKGKPGHWHSLYTDYFVETDLPLPLFMEGKTRGQIARIAAAHHRPDESQQTEMTVRIADRLSSGAERIQSKPEGEQAGFRESRLLSVFDQVELLRHRFKEPGSAFYPLSPLDPGNPAIFPRAKHQSGDPDQYRTHFERFQQALDAFKKTAHRLPEDGGFGLYLDGLLSVLERFTWCVPASTYHTLPDVSLYDHGYSTAGIAQALFAFHQAHGTLPKWGDSEEKFILMAGDLSGIQSYIFDISRGSMRGASKIFRARSFFLQAFVQSVIVEIQRRLGLYSVCRLMESGGKFILLLPLLESVEGKLAKLDAELQAHCRNSFKGLLTLNLCWDTRLSQEDFQLERFAGALDRVNQALERVKYQKLKTALEPGPVLSGDYDERENGNCAICRINAATDSAGQRYKKAQYLPQETEVAICPDCCEQIVAIGGQLPFCNYLVFGKNEKIPLFGDIRLSLCENPPSDPGQALQVQALTPSSDFGRARLARYLPLITEAECADPRWRDLFSQEDDKLAEPGAHKTFTMLAHRAKQADGTGDLVGRSLLTFFKADVDNLGLIFSRGLKNRLSAARFAALSRMLNLFFSEYLAELAQQEYPDIYVVFAGGDDLFLVGPWHQTIRFGIQLRKRFSEFCGQNPDITLSGGILTAKPKLPMRKAAELVEEKLEQAKERKDKDAVCFLDEVYTWADLETHLELGERFDTAVKRENSVFSTAFLYRLLGYHRMYRQFMDPKQATFRSGLYLSLAHYDIGRNIRGQKQAKPSELEMLDRIFPCGVKERPELEHLNVPLFYAINLNRKG